MATTELLRVALAAVLVGAVASCASAPPPGLGRGGPPPPPPPIAGPAGQLFEMRADFWPNLQETLFHQALLPREGLPGRDSLKSLAHVDLAPLSVLSDTERPAWSEGLVFESHFKTSAGLDDEMERGNRFLVDARSRTVLPQGGLPDAWHAALVKASRPYREHFWLEQQAADEAYIERQKPLIAQHGEWLAHRIAAIYDTPWPTVPIVVEVCVAVPPFGARTGGDATAGPPETPLITVSSRDPGYSGESGLEMIFHEASHTLDGKVAELLARSARKQGRKVPWSFGHMIVFYTAGHLVQERLGASGKTYVPYAERGEPGHRILAPKTLAVLQAYWQPYLDGKAPLDVTIDRMVAEIGEVPPPPP
jgi:hypothetical protein